MRILTRYFLKEFFKFFTLVLLSLTAILVVGEFFDKVDEFYSKRPPVHLILQYLLLQAPKFMLYTSPVASLLAILFTIGMASRWRETMVIKASGGSIKRLFFSFVILGVIITLFVLILGETGVPAASRKASIVRNVKILKRPTRITYREKALWLKGLDGSLIRISGFLEDENRILETSIFSFTPSFGLEKMISAEEAQWIDGKWELKNVTIFDFVNNTTTRLDTLFTSAIEEPKIFREEMKKPEEMSFIELHDYYTRLERAGFRNIKYIVRLYEKIAYPTVNLVMIIFGIALALHTGLGGGLRATGLGIAVSVFYWLIYSISISLGNTGAIPPWLAPWIGPILFGTAGCIMYIRIKE